MIWLRDGKGETGTRGGGEYESISVRLMNCCPTEFMHQFPRFPSYLTFFSLQFAPLCSPLPHFPFSLLLLTTNPFEIASRSPQAASLQLTLLYV